MINAEIFQIIFFGFILIWHAILGIYLIWRALRDFKAVPGAARTDFKPSSKKKTTHSAAVRTGCSTKGTF
jgi:hypothetical protein